jgi:hypothetical protein
LRCAFSAHQWPRLRADLFGRELATRIDAVASLPRIGQSLVRLLDGGRTLSAACSAARLAHTSIPDASEGLARMLAAYRMSTLAAFHHRYHADLAAMPAGADPPRIETLPPCVAACLRQPNDLLLKPEHLQHLVRSLGSRDWSPARIARLVQGLYDADHGWGDRWTRRMDSGTRAEFEVRVFAGLLASGVDSLIDFNCVSAQEKGLCPQSGCQYDLRRDRARLTAEQV